MESCDSSYSGHKPYTLNTLAIKMPLFWKWTSFACVANIVLFSGKCSGNLDSFVQKMLMSLLFIVSLFLYFITLCIVILFFHSTFSPCFFSLFRFGVCIYLKLSSFLLFLQRFLFSSCKWIFIMFISYCIFMKV